MEFSRLQIASNWKLLPFSNFLQKVNIHAWFFLPMFLYSHCLTGFTSVFAGHEHNSHFLILLSSATWCLLHICLGRC
ncbi:hypothetical protein CGMCC3_g897 [Colletotrichum fructicola]|nr:uncharacterized protein CGMCC3_g897 [Colletotrichum fructicola]KAE9582776.1 hypothetical protein CGMCC3_g897 [Colletotrichum fructicola]